MTDHVKEATDILIRSWGYEPDKMHPDDYADHMANVAAVAPYLMSVGYAQALALVGDHDD